MTNNTTRETISDMVRRLEQAFRKGPTSKEREQVVREIISMSANRAAIVSLRLYQYLSPDQYLTGALCRMMEATTYGDEHEVEEYEVWDYLYNGIDGKFAFVCKTGTWAECKDFIGNSVSDRFKMNKIEK